MTPNPPSSSDGSGLPPRPRPNMGNLAKDTGESDLWAFEDLESGAEEPIDAPIRTAEPIIPSPRISENTKLRQHKDAVSPKPGVGSERIKVNVGKARPKIQAGPPSGQSKPGTEFDDLDHWDESELPAPSPAVAPVPEPAPVIRAAIPQPAPPIADEVDEFSPVVPANATPVSLQPRLNLTLIERVGLLTLLALLVIGGIVVFLNTISGLPDGTDRVNAKDFPIQGKHLTILTAETYWRAPKSGEPVRRDTQLIPVVDITASGGPAAVKVFFRNSNGEVVGDAVTRSLQAGGKVQVAATSGFDDIGMHAAYRTGQSTPWTIDVMEAPKESATGDAYLKLFEMDIAPDRR